LETTMNLRHIDHSSWSHEIIGDRFV
jgi:hypothetical protein